MNILIDIGHPAHVHYFRNLAKLLQNKGHEVIITVKKLPSAICLLENYGLNFIVLPEKSDSIFGKAVGQIIYDWTLIKISKKYNIDFALGVSITIAHLSYMTKVKSFVFDDDDDEIQPLFVKWSHPFATELISPDVLRGKQKRKDVIYYPGYHELAYLHPNYFTPDGNVLSDIGLTKNDPFFILRFNAFKAHHDGEVKGLSFGQKLKLVDILTKKGKIFITGERELPPEFEQYRITKLEADKIHSLIYYAQLFIGDSQTMASEASVLGTPSIRFNSLVGKISYLEEEENKYGLTYGFKPGQFDNLLIKVNELLNRTDLRKEWEMKRQNMLKDKIDVTMFWLWFIENYPISKNEYLVNPDLVYKFK